MKKCIVIPCYNVESHIESVIESIPDFIDDIIVVDDKSSDNTLKIIKELSKSNPRSISLKMKSTGV
jgi:glycosyltransferase involved in cell wall biosynthesis